MTQILPYAGKPVTVNRAELALWAWTLWTFVFGCVQSRFQVPEIENEISSQLEGLVTITPTTLFEVFFACYAILALASVWIILKISAGKKWARASLLLGTVIDIVWTALVPEDTTLEHLADIPDLGLQFYALYLLYREPANSWFTTGRLQRVQ